MKNKKSTHLFRGQSMIEVLVALGAAVIIISSITTAVITSLNNTQFSESQNMATHYAQQGLDQMRQLRDNDYGTFEGSVGIYCLGENQLLQQDNNTCRPNVYENRFIRTIELINPSGDDNKCNENNPSLTLTQVTSTVAWTDGKCQSTKPYCHEVSLVSCLSSVTAAPDL